ncbi:uncharacterized protein LOC132201652 isoform X2 [Neocloeon triangulifer]|uniref:uncharacterized protein LOC132201652 isoform X2 n=1 Tax=Neocloeon triangulifer TaxID=2078957 RepID=UPI00286F097D|nr:uncharacterized protein LOC132201652 isoform X2 [Neocloeon triangulifer]
MSNAVTTSSSATSISTAITTPTQNRKALALDLKRSNKVDFARERSFVQFSRRSNSRHNGATVQQQHQAAVAAAASRAANKPSLEIYRPPSTRANIRHFGLEQGANCDQPSSRLNVHAKEFTINSRNNQLKVANNKNRGQQPNAGDIQQSMSLGNMLSTSSSRVHFHEEARQMPLKGIMKKPTVTPGGLQRSKSMGAADSIKNREPGISPQAPELGIFPGEALVLIERAVTDPNQLSSRSLMSLVRQVLQRVIESARYAAPAAKFCISVIEKEKQETFLETLLNTCTQWYHERDRHLRLSASTAVLLQGAPAPSCPRWVAYMTFLNEMYCQLKRRQLQLRTKPQGISPEMHLLGLLYDSCFVCLKPPAINSLGETECLFYVLTSIGRDLDSEMKQRMPKLMSALRDAFVDTSIPGVRKTLMQLIEMRASRWQMPASAVLYYYPGTSAIK